MDSFELLVAGLLRRKGFWVWPSYKVNLTKEEKRAIGRPSSPRWEIDLVAYQGATNEVLVVECKSFLDSPGVTLSSIQSPKKENRYKLFNDEVLRRTVLSRLTEQLCAIGACAPHPRVRLALATGHIKSSEDRASLTEYFKANDWKLWDDHWLANELRGLVGTGWDDDQAALVVKLINAGLETELPAP